MAAQKKKKKKQRLPFGVGCLAFWMFLASALCLACLAVLAAHVTKNDLVNLPSETWTKANRLGIVGLAIVCVYGILGLPTSIGLMFKKLWAYYLYNIFTGFAIGMDGYGAIMGPRPSLWVPIVWHCLITWYMFRPRVRQVFN